MILQKSCKYTLEANFHSIPFVYLAKISIQPLGAKRSWKNKVEDVDSWRSSKLES